MSNEPEDKNNSFFLNSYTCTNFFFSSRRRHTRLVGDWSSDVCSSDLPRADLLQNGLVGFPCSPRDFQESSPTPQFKSINSLHSAFFTVQLSHPYMTTGKTIALTRWIFVGKVMSLLLNMLSRLVITFLLNMLSRLVITFLPRSKHL